MRGVNLKSKIYYLFSVVIIAFLVAQCNPEKHFHTLSFFFDGVPQPAHLTRQVSDSTSGDSLVIEKRAFKPEFYTHKPYEEEKCGSCHEEGYSNSLSKPMPNLCYSCHEDFNSVYKSLHGPVASGNCLTCHNHHMSKYEKLLDRSGQQLCLYCHESGLVMKNKMHAKIENRNCTECHSPHGGENSGMLTSGSCSNCHQSFASKYPFLHGPVASGNCTVCHESHYSKSRHYLSRDSQQLCLFCHNQDRLLSTPTHSKIKKTNCTECHNPHGGKDRMMLLTLLKAGNNLMSDSASKLIPDNTIQKDDTLKINENQK